MLLVHLSDIHLKAADFGNDMDENQNLRRKLIEDVCLISKEVGKIPSCIIISGDIAYAAKPQEYEFAKNWLRELCNKCGAQYKDIFVIPGNHDVDRNNSNQMVLSSLYDKIRSVSDHTIGKHISEILTDPLSAEILLSPLQNYNNFAKDFECDIKYPSKTYLEKDFPLNDNYTIKIWGVNSVLASNKNDSKNPGNMYIAPSYNKIFNEDGYVNILACHHPQEWIANRDAFYSHVSENCKVILYGHEHKNTFINGRDYFQVSSSAVIPDNDGSGTLPGYNLLNINENNGNVIIDLYIREWQNNPSRFREKRSKDNDIYVRSIFSIPPKNKNHNIHSNEEKNIKTRPQLNEVTSAVFEKKNHLHSQQSTESSLHNGEIINFLKLTVNQRKRIAIECDLWSEEFISLSDKEFSKAVINSAIKSNKLNQLLIKCI